MARRVRDAVLETRNARRGLPIRSKPYWRALDKGLHLGYRRTKKGGSWLVRRYIGNEDYSQNRIGSADDFQDADGLATFDYNGAIKDARLWFESEIRKENGLNDPVGKVYTVADVMNDYEAHYKIEGRGIVTIHSAMNAHILPALGSIPVDKLTTKKITDWHRAVAAKPAQLRTGKHQGKRNFREVSDDEEVIRKRRASANRVLTILKAALNYVWKEGKVASDTAWRKVRPFKNCDAPVVRYLTQDECVRFTNACPPDFRKMCNGALLTGCRYSEVAKLKACDFNPDSNNVLVRKSKNGKSRHVNLSDEGVAFFRKECAGKTGETLIFVHDDGSPWKKSHQFRLMRQASEAAKIVPSIGFHVLRHTHGSMLAMKGVPIPVIAKQLGHADTRITERHYAHLSPNYVADTIRQNFPKLGIVADDKVAVLRPKKKALA